MKAFWLVILALVVVGAGLLFAGKPRSESTATSLASDAKVQREGNEPLDRFGSPATPRPDVAQNVTIVPKDVPKDVAGDANVAPGQAAIKPDQAKPDQANSASHAAGYNPQAAATNAPAKPEGAGKSGTLADFEIAPGDIKPQADGTTLVDGRFTIKGDGTEANPYRVPWEMLISANEVFDPSKSLNKIPQRIQMLEGKHVRLTGYVAFPLMVQRPRELLSMLNQWDGCCIGVPPTPYDAVEVKLKKAVGNKEKYANAGQVQGIFRTEPYVVKNWLVGMYVMNDATFTPVDTGDEPAAGESGSKIVN